jgi:hypothetical protein
MSTPSRLVTGLITTGLIAVLTTTLVACGGAGQGSGTAAAGGTATGGTSALEQERAILHQYANCVRSQGYPNFPDPQANAQGISLAVANPRDKEATNQTKAACSGILNRLPATARGQQGPITAAQLRQARLWAACMRRNGLPLWPDPGPDGSFRLAGTPYEAMGKTGPVLAGLQACRQYENFGGIRVS